MAPRAQRPATTATPTSPARTRTSTSAPCASPSRRRTRRRHRCQLARRRSPSSSRTSPSSSAAHFTGPERRLPRQRAPEKLDFLPDRSRESVRGAWRKALRKYVPYYLYNYVLFPALAGPMFWKVLLGNWLAETLRDVYSAATIFCGHVGEDVKSYPEGTRAHGRGEWYAMQVEATNDFEVSWPVSVLCGGLDRQIEHHLFPQLPPQRLREIAPEVARALRDVRRRLPDGHLGPHAEEGPRAHRRARPAREACARSSGPWHDRRRDAGRRRRRRDSSPTGLHHRRARGRGARAEPHDPLLPVASGALMPPEIRGRVAYYGPAHVERLKLIAQLQDRGLRIDAIRDLLGEHRPRRAGPRRVARRRAAGAGAVGERPAADGDRGGALRARRARAAPGLLADLVARAPRRAARATSTSCGARRCSASR